jgi:hypothetical protein
VIRNAFVDGRIGRVTRTVVSVTQVLPMSRS